jgi:hypothetical protein
MKVVPTVGVSQDHGCEQFRNAKYISRAEVGYANSTLELLGV